MTLCPYQAGGLVVGLKLKSALHFNTFSLDWIFFNHYHGSKIFWLAIRSYDNRGASLSLERIASNGLILAGAIRLSFMTDLTCYRSECVERKQVDSIPRSSYSVAYRRSGHLFPKSLTLTSRWLLWVHVRDCLGLQHRRLDQPLTFMHHLCFSPRWVQFIYAEFNSI